MEELHIQKSSDLPNDTLIFIFELHFGYDMEVQPNDPLAFSKRAVAGRSLPPR